MTASVRGAGKTYGTVGVEQQKELTGLQFVQGLVDGTLPLNTMAGTLGYDVIEVAPGRVVVAIEPNGQHLNPSGTVHGGLAAILLDSCMGLAIRTTHDRGVGSTTLEFKISLLRLIMPSAGLIRAEGVVLTAAAASVPPKDGSRTATDGCSRMARRRAWFFGSNEP